MSMNRDNFKKELFDISNNEFRRNGFTLSVEARMQLREIISAGVDRMLYEEMHNDFALSRARKNIIVLSRKLCDIETSPRRIVENRTFTAARFKICPIWPFC